MMMGWQGREVKAFLVETWELFYWSLWCPSKLQERMNQICGKDTEAHGFDILWPDSADKFRFVSQYFLISFILSIPIVVLSNRSPIPVGWLLALSSIITYGIGLFYLPAGISWAMPLPLALTASQASLLDFKYFVNEKPYELSKYFLPWPQLLSGFPMGYLALFLSVYMGCALLKKNLNIGRGILFFGISSIISLGTFSLTRSILVSVLSVGLAGVFSFLLRGSITADPEATLLVVFFIVFVASVPAIVVTDGLASAISSAISDSIPAILVGMALGIGMFFSKEDHSRVLKDDDERHEEEVFLVGIIISVVVGFVLLRIPRLMFLPYLTTCAVIAIAFAPTKNYLSPIGLIITMLLLGFQNLGLQVLWTIPVILCGYYRIFPDYLIFIISSLLNTANQFTRSWIKNKTPKTNALTIARRFPAFESEILWFPIPRHDLVLINAFEQSPSQALAIYQKLQSNPLPGAQTTIKNALPGILANCLKAPRTTADLLKIQSKNHPQLSLLIPEYYQEDNPTNTLSDLQPEIADIFPLLQTFLNDLSISLKSSNPALRIRGLESLQNNLPKLPRLLPRKSVSRWQAVLTHWQTLLELELIEQRKLSQGELLDPFKFGNPLDSRDAFKGRRKLADRLYRLILDRNRPTLVLHGPRRFGKSSFLKNLPRLLPSDLIPIYLDLQSSALSSSEPDFCYGLVRAIHRDTRTQNLNLPAPPSRQDFKTNPYTTLEDWLDIALPLLPDGRHLLLNLDEFERIGTAIAEGKLSLNLLNELRHLIQHRDELAFMFSGVQTLNELGPNWSSYFISVVPIEILYLEPHEAKDLLLDPDPDFKMRYEDNLVETIIHLTHCHPYLLQLIGACLVEQANIATVKTATHNLLELAIPEAFTKAEPYFTNVWTEFTGTTPEEIAAGQQILITIAQSQTPDYSTPEAQLARRRMIRFHVITEDDRIEIPLLERWIIERAIDL